VLALASEASTAAPEPPAGAADVNRATAVVQVGPSTITAADILAVKDRLPAVPPTGDPLADRRARIAPVVHARLLVLEAVARGYDDPELEREVARFERERLVAELEANEIRARIVLDPEAVEEGCRRAGKTLHLRQIVTRSAAAAESLRTRALAGESFADLARAHSLDPATAALGGRLPPVTWGTFAPALEEAAYRLAPGEIAGPLAFGPGFVLVELDSAVTRAADPDSLRAVVTETLAAARFRVGQVAFLDTMKTRLQAAVVAPHLDRFLGRMGTFAARVAAGDSIPPAPAGAVSGAESGPAADRFGFTPAERALPLLTWDLGQLTIGDYADYMAPEPAERAAERADRGRVSKDLDQYFRHRAYADYARAAGYGAVVAEEVARARERALIGRLVAAEGGPPTAPEAGFPRIEALIASLKERTPIVYDDRALTRLPF
jgi:peptidyl-prolyl cis-trans isomerase C